MGLSATAISYYLKIMGFVKTSGPLISGPAVMNMFRASGLSNEHLGKVLLMESLIPHRLFVDLDVV